MRRAARAGLSRDMVAYGHVYVARFGTLSVFGLVLPARAYRHDVWGTVLTLSPHALTLRTWRGVVVHADLTAAAHDEKVGDVAVGHAAPLHLDYGRDGVLRAAFAFEGEDSRAFWGRDC